MNGPFNFLTSVCSLVTTIGMRQKRRRQGNCFLIRISPPCRGTWNPSVNISIATPYRTWNLLTMSGGKAVAVNWLVLDPAGDHHHRQGLPPPHVHMWTCELQIKFLSGVQHLVCATFPAAACRFHTGETRRVHFTSHNCRVIREGFGEKALL